MNKKDFLVFIEIDIECSDLLDEKEIAYVISEVDSTQNMITFTFTEDEIKNIFKSIQFMNANEKIISSKILNSELSEYTTKVSIEKPNGDTISFY